MSDPTEDEQPGQPSLGADPFGGMPFGQPPPGGPPILVAGAAPQVPANSLATLSLVLAFIFAPAGAVLAHLGLSQIKRTGQPGRGRAVAALVVSYTVIAVAVGALVISTVSPARPHTPAAAHPGPSAPGPPPHNAAPPAPAPPRVAVAGLADLLVTTAQLQTMAGDTAVQPTLTFDHVTAPTGGGTPDRMECLGTISLADPRVLDAAAIQGMHLAAYTDVSGTGKILTPVQAALGYADAGAAQAAAQGLLAKWRACSGSSFGVTFQGHTSTFSVGPLSDAGHGVTALTTTAAGGILTFDRAVAAKANVLVDVMITSRASQAPLAIEIANAILDKIPG